MERKNVIGHNLRIIRKSKNCTQKDLVAKMNLQGIKIDEPMLSRIESETRPVFDYEVYAIAYALNIRIEDLFNKKKSLSIYNT
ncbi:helix-turn-helix transcriptional regulator [Clostridium sp. YIM B02505]|uniref:Helix-turn-helix transcriptional regulator n=1 Tax=Clostridium yunnanense TaxID=2800325 RepID=A0ABS1EQI9_9CLOT|nr:helix-turn-helix transcriptional regulator [Clostridium yunnanense]MBK1811650.1 helix-turn-helix transcriptional regulator [Clostridium yunnanense]